MTEPNDRTAARLCPHLGGEGEGTVQPSYPAAWKPGSVGTHTAHVWLNKVLA